MRSRLLLCFLLLPLWAGVASGEAFRQWLPWESWAGGKQYDARLDTPVACWRAGITLEEAFGSVREQTGVVIGFRPENDENRRVRVNLFLNPQQPPTLRDVMVQLSWVVDCPFSMSEENGATVYSLMSTSMGAGAEQAMAARRAARVQAREQLWQALDEGVEECRQALLLSPQEAARTYRGVNDHLLLTLLDPARRAAAQVVCRHYSGARPESWAAVAEADVITNGTGLSPTLLTSEDFADLAVAFEVPESAVRSEDRESYVEVGLLEGDQAEVKLTLEPQLVTGPDGQMTAIGEQARHIIVSLPKGRPLGATEEVRLRRLLGTPLTPEEEAAFVKQRSAEMARAAQQRMQATEEAGRTVSEAARQRLTGLQLPLRHADDAQAVPLWQVFEEIARASGYHIISDAFITGGVGVSVEKAGKLEGRPFEAWEELAALTRGEAGRGFRVPQWEWGDAGSFLHFRTSNRDIYRAAMLPDHFLRMVDAVVRRPGPVDEKARAIQRTVPIDVADWAGPLARLTDMQLGHASLVTQAAPDDLMGNVRQEVIRSVLSSAGSRNLVRFLGSLNEEQWARVRGEGITGPAEVTPEQMQWLVAWAKAEELFRAGDFSRISVRIADTAEDPNIARLLTTARGDPTYYLEANAWRLQAVRVTTDIDTEEASEEKEEIGVANQQGPFLPKQVTVRVELPERQ